MDTLANISAKRSGEGIFRAGWVREGQTGSHLILTKAGQRATLIIPQHCEVKSGTLCAIIRAAGLTVEEFHDLL
jgi:predicted RNA binding protein YcfA (HicA-like mRNA interferase family)